MTNQGYGKAVRKTSSSRHATPYERPKRQLFSEENGQEGSIIRHTLSALTSFASNYFTFRPKVEKEKDDTESESSEDDAPMSPVKHSLPQKPSPFQLGQGGHAKLDLAALIQEQKNISPEEYDRLSKLLRDKVADKKAIKNNSPPQLKETKQFETTFQNQIPPSVSVVPPPPVSVVSPPQSSQSAIKPVPVHAKGQTPIDVVGSFLGRGKGREAVTPKPKEQQTNGTFYSSTPMLNGSASFTPARKNLLKRPLSPPTNGSTAPSKQLPPQPSAMEEEEPVYLDRQPPFKLQRRAPLAASETAKRILQALDQMSSPLADRNPKLSSVLKDNRLTSERVRPTEKLMPRRVEKPATRFVKPPVPSSYLDNESQTQDVPPTESIDTPLLRKEKRPAQNHLSNGTASMEEEKPKSPTSYVMKREKRERTETVYKRPGSEFVEIEEEGEDLQAVAAKKYQNVAALPQGHSWDLQFKPAPFEAKKPNVQPEKEEPEPEKPNQLKSSDGFPTTPNNSFAEKLPQPMFVEPADKRDKEKSSFDFSSKAQKVETYPFGKVEEKTHYMFSEEKPIVAEKTSKDTSSPEDKPAKTPQLPFVSSTLNFLGTDSTPKVEEKIAFAPMPEVKLAPKTEDKISTIFGSTPAVTSIFGSSSAIAAPSGGFVFGNEKPEEKPKSPVPEEKEVKKEPAQVLMAEPPKVPMFAAPVLPLVPTKTFETEKKEPEAPQKVEVPKEKTLWPETPKETVPIVGFGSTPIVFDSTPVASASTGFSATQTASMSDANDSSMEQEHDDKSTAFGQSTTLAPSSSGFSFASASSPFVASNSSLPFGTSSTFASGSMEPSSTMFGSSSTKSDSGFASVTPSFGSQSTFGQTSSAFGQSAPAFGSSASAFGSSAPAFGSSAPAFGSSAPSFGQSAPAFGSTVSAFGSSVSFGQSAPAFGSTASAFGSTASAFGSSVSFGQSAPAFGSTTTAFGSSAPAFGSSAPAFGQTSSAFGQPAFGQTGSAPAFGSSGSGFNFQTQGSTMFSSTPAFAFGNPSVETPASSSMTSEFIFVGSTPQQHPPAFSSSQTQSNGLSFGQAPAFGAGANANSPFGAPQYPVAGADPSNLFNVGATDRKVLKGRRSKKRQ